MSVSGAHGRRNHAQTSSARRARRVAVITGTRADYGILRSPMEAIRAHRALELQVVVTGMHLLRKFGRTVEQIQRDGWTIDARVPMQRGDDTPLDQANGLSRGVSGIAAFLERSGTDIVVVLGDRIEAMAGALAAVSTGRILAHIHGGDVAPGDFDECFRHAITKLGHVHLTATKRAARRVIRMGENEDRVHCVGAPGLDHLLKIVRGFKPNHTTRKRRPATERHALIVQHPCGRPASVERRVMELILTCVEKEDLPFTMLYPNSDRGHSGIVAAIEAWGRKRSPDGRIRIHRSLDRDRYLRLLAESDVLIGNSSSGIVEAASAGTAVVNVGSRQCGRERSGRSVVDADESTASILAALRSALRKRPIIGKPTVYGNGRAGVRIARILARVPLSDSFRRKILSA